MSHNSKLPTVQRTLLKKYNTSTLLEDEGVKDLIVGLGDEVTNLNSTSAAQGRLKISAASQRSSKEGIKGLIVGLG